MTPIFKAIVYVIVFLCIIFTICGIFSIFSEKYTRFCQWKNLELNIQVCYIIYYTMLDILYIDRVEFGNFFSFIMTFRLFFGEGEG